MVKARKYVVKKHFKGVPKRDDYEVVEYETPPLQDNEILVKVEWISVDPYLRVTSFGLEVPYDQFGFQVGVVHESRNSEYPVGTRVVTHKGWSDYSVIKNFTGKAGIYEPFDRVYKLPDLKGLSPSLGVGAVGMPGASAYFGFLEGCKPKAGETVVVTGAAGAVGTIVGQIAKIKGCKVIGFTGSDDKVKWLENELGFDKAFNYKTVNVQNALKEAAPNGVDCYFDNVGGELSSIIIHNMNQLGRVAVIGSISSYNNDSTQLPKATILQPVLVLRSINIRGLSVSEWRDQWDEAFSQLVEWIKNGQIKNTEHVTEGFENVVDAFLGMLEGENKGKAVVKI